MAGKPSVGGGGGVLNLGGFLGVPYEKNSIVYPKPYSNYYSSYIRRDPSVSGFSVSTGALAHGRHGFAASPLQLLQ